MKIGIFAINIFKIISNINTHNQDKNNQIYIDYYVGKF
jgi:hypothetical protein